jgi:uroporphyrinogen decarboxylase
MNGYQRAPLLVRALRGERVERPPVWFMRQAGRSLPEYRALRTGRTLLELARTPELTAEVTLQPVRRHAVDAAILFSDIVVPLAAVGVDLEIRPGVGPVIAAPIRTAADVRRLRPLVPDEDLPEVAQAVRLVCADADRRPHAPPSRRRGARHTRHELPFLTGRRRPLADAVAELP